MSNFKKTEEEWIDEKIQGVRYGLRGKILINEQTQYQKITLIESQRYGKALLLDGCWMTAEHLEKHYHECLVHPALCSAKSLDKVLIIGGGDGGTAKTCLLYREIDHIDLVEIDKRVIELSQKYLPAIGGMAWKDSRLNLHIEDGVYWVNLAPENSYDVVIVDGADPKGPAEGLFNKKFFQNCRRILKPGGIFATQSESPEAFKEIHIATIKILREVFEFADPLYGCVPIYPSGWWSWTFGCMESDRYKYPIARRVSAISDHCEIWSDRWQKGAFEAIPAFIERQLQQ